MLSVFVVIVTTYVSIVTFGVFRLVTLNMEKQQLKALYYNL